MTTSYKPGEGTIKICLFISIVPRSTSQAISLLYAIRVEVQATFLS